MRRDIEQAKSLGVDGVASNEMGEAYEAAYGTPCIPMIGNG